MNKSTDAQLEVYLDSEMTEGPERIGSLFSHQAHVRFRYDKAWIKRPQAFELDPDLQLADGDFHPAPAQGNFGVFLDSSPDRWGQTLMQRREQVAARKEGRPVRTLHAWDFLLGVQDETRMGALRFRRPGEDPFLDDHLLPAPPVADLRALEAVASRVASREALNDLDQLEKWLSVLVAPGASLGGARPKANFRDADGSLWIAKFPSRDDQRDFGLWEKLVHDLAADAGIDVPASRAVRFGGDHHTFCVKRFDRTGQKRHFMASAMTVLQRSDGGDSYLDLGLEYIQDRGVPAHIAEDKAQLFRRVLFNVMVGNRDDHLRNHAFMLTNAGWRPSPAYDITPCHEKTDHVLKLDSTSSQPSIRTVIETAELYGLSDQQASETLQSLTAVVSTWRARAKDMGLPRGDIELTANAFGALDEWEASAEPKK